ncbi:hypothetical protein ACFYXD_35505 [Streptomyces platensis]|uniref:hypothetical protein n=1 Tax=Streptomyces platensis TaxID=58346 RepID=UPI0036ACBDFF
MNHDALICTQEAAHAAGLDVAPTPSELIAMADAIVRTWGDRSAEPEDEVGSTADAGAQLARALPLVLAELDRVRSERDAFADRVDTLTAVAKSNKRHVQAMYADLQTANRERDELKQRIAALEDAAICPSVAKLYGTRCTLPVRHRGEHQDPEKRQFWTDEHAAPAA